MPRRILFAAQRANGWKLVALCLLAGLLVPGVIWYRASITGSADRKVCAKIDRLDAALLKIVDGTPAPGPHDYGYAYWRAHHVVEPNGAPGGAPSPAIVAELRKAACDPRNLP